ncbi:hypothetical protein ABKV19_014084 [Rosa sericea]
MKSLAVCEERQKLMQFLMGLNESYSATRGQILLMQPLPSVKKAYSMISQEEKQRELTVARTNDSMAMLAINESRNQPGSSKQNMRNNYKGKRESLYCTNCKNEGHSIERCYWIIGFPPGHRLHKEGESSKPTQNPKQPQRSKQQPSAHNVQTTTPIVQQLQTIAPGLTAEQYDQIMGAVNNECINPSEGLSFSTCLLSRSSSKLSDAWIIDSGATDHITKSSHLFTNTSSTPVTYVLLSNGQKAKIYSVGTASLDSNLKLQDVLCVPSFNTNLLSIPRLTQSLHCCAIFFPTFVFYRTWKRRR